MATFFAAAGAPSALADIGLPVQSGGSAPPVPATEPVANTVSTAVETAETVAVEPATRAIEETAGPPVGGTAVTAVAATVKVVADTASSAAAAVDEVAGDTTSAARETVETGARVIPVTTERAPTRTAPAAPSAESVALQVADAARANGDDELRSPTPAPARSFEPGGVKTSPAPPSVSPTDSNRFPTLQPSSASVSPSAPAGDHEVTSGGHTAVHPSHAQSRRPGFPSGSLPALLAASASASGGALVTFLAALAATLFLAAPGLGRWLRLRLAPWPQPVPDLSLEWPG